MSRCAGKGSACRAAAAGVIAGLALMALPTLSAAEPATAGTSGAAADRAVAHRLTDIGAAKRKRRAVRRSHGPSAAGMAFMGMAMGMMGAAIAESQRRDYYDRYYGYGGPYYYQRGFGYYGGHYRHRPYYYRY